MKPFHISFIVNIGLDIKPNTTVNLYLLDLQRTIEFELLIPSKIIRVRGMLRTLLNDIL